MKTNQLKAGVALSYVTKALQIVISLIYTPFMLSMLGQNEYGLYQLAASVISYLGLLKFGFGSSYLRFYTKYKVNDDEEGVKKLNGMYLLAFSAISFICLIAGIILSQNIELVFSNGLTDAELIKSKYLMMVMTVTLSITLISSVFTSYVTSNEQFIFQRLLNLAKTLLSPFVMIIFLFLGYKSITMTIISLVLTVTSFIVNVYYCKNKLQMKFNFRDFNMSLFKDIALFSSIVFINDIVYKINFSIDRVILGSISGTAAVAVYSIGSQLNTYFFSISTSVSSVFAPKINQIVSLNDDNNKLTNLMIRVGRIQFILLIFILSGFIFVGQPFISAWAGSEYKDSYFVALILMSTALTPLIQNLGIFIQQAKNKHHFRSYAYLIIAIINIIITIPLARLYGPIGSAIGTGIAATLGAGLIMNIYYNKLGLDMIKFWKNILSFLPGLIIPISFGIITKMYVAIVGYWDILLWGLAYTVVFLVSVWFISLNNEEKGLLSKPIKTIYRKISGK